MKKPIFLLIAFLLLSPITLYAQSGPYQQKTQDKSQNTTKDQKTPNKPTFINKIPRTNSTQYKTTDKTDHANIEPVNDRIARFTKWLVIVASVQATIFIAQLIAMSIQAKHLHKTVAATEKAADAARKSADVLYATERPHIHADVGVVSGGLKEDVYTTKIQFRVWNYGKTPAIIRWIKILHNSEPKIPEGTDESVFPRKFGLCMLSKGTPFIETVPIYMKRQDWENIDTHEATKSIFLLIRVEYEDVFGNPDTRDFWWVYKPIDHVWSQYKYPEQK